MNELPSIDESVMEGDGRYAQDNKLIVKFYKYAIRNEPKSEEAGFNVFDEHDFIEISIPGDVKSTYTGRVSLEHRVRFKAQWAAYLAGSDQALTGTPLDKLPGMSVSLVATLNGLKITTVEQLAGLSDQLSTGIHGINELRRKASAYLAVAKGDVVKGNTDDIEVLKKQIADLTAQLKPAAAVEAKKAA